MQKHWGLPHMSAIGSAATCINANVSVDYIVYGIVSANRDIYNAYIIKFPVRSIEMQRVELYG